VEVKVAKITHTRQLAYVCAVGQSIFRTGRGHILTNHIGRPS